METIKNIKLGDIFYIEINKKYFFMQIIHITKDLPPPYDIDYKFGYFIVVFEKSFKELAKSTEELDLVNIYKVKYRPKNSILFVSHWDKFPEIKLKPDSTDYKKHSRYNLIYFGNTKISEKFIPDIHYEFIMPAHFTENSDGVIISHSPNDINWIFYILLQDEERRKDKIKNVELRYFEEWKENIDIDIIIKTEKIIQKFDVSDEKNNTQKELKKSVIGINKLNEKNNFIMTTEAENIYDKLVEISIKHGIKEAEAEKIIEDNRDW
jgi:hypothetical protein